MELARARPRHRPSLAPLALALAGLALAIVGAWSPWMHSQGARVDINGFGGGWIIANATGHLHDSPATFNFEHGADGVIAVAVCCAAVVLAALNLRRVDQRFDRAQFAAGALIIAVFVYNYVFIHANAHEHLVSDPEGQADAPGGGLALVLLAGIVTCVGALLGNTPEFRFDDAPPLTTRRDAP